MYSSLPKTNVEVNAQIQLPETIGATKTPGAETAPAESAQTSDCSVPKGKSGYECAYCKKRFWKKAKFQHHTRSHTQERLFKCDNCSLSFNYQSSWKKHTLKRRGSAQKCLHCDMTFCFQRTLITHLKVSHADAVSDPPALPVSLNYGEDEDPMLGELPGIEDPLEETLISEISQAKQQRMKCLHSDLTFSNEQPFCQHTNNCHGDSSLINSITSTGLHPLQKALEEDSINPEIKEFQGKHFCPFCNQNFPNGGKLKVHLESHSDEFQCDHCSYTSSKNSNIARHKKTRGRKEGIVYNCDECTFMSCTTNYLRIHMIQNHLEEDIPALEHPGHPAEPPLLTWTTKTASNRWSHQDLQLELLEKTQEVCRFCKRVFGGSNKKWLLEEHMRIHMGEDEPFKCSQCSYSCAEQSGLHHHRRLHLHLPSSPEDNSQRNGNMRERAGEGESVKPYKCTYCNYRSVRPRVIRYHERSHRHEVRHAARGDKREIHHQITAQPKFPQIGSPVVPKLVDHQSIENKKRFKCTLCNYRSDRIGHVRNHERTHTTMKKQFECKTCGARFTQRSSLLNHRETHYT